MGFDINMLLWAALLIAFLMLVMRWVFKPSRPRTGRPESGPEADLGLLSPVLSAGPRGEALQVKTCFHGKAFAARSPGWIGIAMTCWCSTATSTGPASC